MRHSRPSSPGARSRRPRRSPPGCPGSGFAHAISRRRSTAFGCRRAGRRRFGPARRAQIEAALRRHAGTRGIWLLRAANDELRENACSPRETRTRLLLVRAGICDSEPEPNGSIELHHGGRTRGDLVFRRERVVVEYEGEQHLIDAVQWAIDLQRYNDLALSGWLVIRLSKRMGDAEILARVRHALRLRRD